MEKYGPVVEKKIATDNPSMSVPERKAKTSEFLKESWGRFSDKKRAEFMPKAEPEKEVSGESFDLKFEGLFGKGESAMPSLDLDDILDNFVDSL
jgi:hypothetical protein